MSQSEESCSFLWHFQFFSLTLYRHSLDGGNELLAIIRGLALFFEKRRLLRFASDCTGN